MCFPSKYREDVIKLLHEAKSCYSLLHEDQLVPLQQKIEDLSMKYDDRIIYNIIPNLIKRLIRKELPTAKDYLKKCLKDNTEILELLTYLGHYSLEAIILNVLCTVFNSLNVNTAVRVSTLVQQLDSTVRLQSKLFRQSKKGYDNKIIRVRKKKKK